MEAWEHRSIPVPHVLILVFLGLMGLMLPSGKLWLKVVYTAIEIGLIFFGTTLGYLHILPTLYLIVVIRSCFLFEQPGRLAIADNGKGFKLDQNTEGFGLQGMQERAIALGGCCFIDSQPGTGCRIAVQLPLLAASPNPLLTPRS